MVIPFSFPPSGTRTRIPQEWTMSKVIFLFKKGDRSDTNNYRGIIFLNSCYQLYARIITTRLQNIAETLLEEERHGFRIGRSCIDCILTIQQVIEKLCEKNLETHIA